MNPIFKDYSVARTVDGALYVPNESDREMADLAAAIQAQLLGTSKPPIHFGTKKTLGQVAPGKRLYVLGHGTVSGTMIVKTGHPKDWTPDQLATQLIGDGLPNTLQSLELFVCNAAKYAAKNNEARKTGCH